jgi:hypothetical protein
MKKTLLSVLLTLTAMIVLGQARLGSTALEIKSEFRGKKYKLKDGHDNDGNYYITIETKRATVAYFFNSDLICTQTLIIPNSQGALNFYVERYNRQYVIESPTKWKMYSKAGIAEIELFFTDDGCFFVWE